MIGHLYTGAERESRLQALFVAEETDYGDGATIAPAGLNAILAMNVKTTPIAGQLVERQVVQPYLGARPSQRVGQHMQIEFELEAAGSGTAATPPAIRQGADDDGEMGVLHVLAQPQREANLRIRLAEYLRFGLQAGLFYAT